MEQACHGRPQTQVQVSERVVLRQVLQRMCPQPDRTSRLQFAMLLFAEHFGQENVKSSFAKSICGRLLLDELDRVLWFLSVRAGPCAIIALHAGIPLAEIPDQGNSRSPSAWDLAMALFSLPFCLKTACVMSWATCSFHTGMQSKLGMA